MCGNKNDPFLTYLKAFGYNPIRLPRSNIHPLQVMVRQGKELTWLGELTEVFVCEEPAPELQRDNPAAGISGKRTGELSIGLAISLLGNVIGALGGSKLGIGAAYKNAKSATFEFPDVLEDHVSVVRLDQFLGQSDVNPNSVAIAKMLESDDIFIATSCIKSRKFTLDTKSSKEGGVQIDVPVIQEAVGGSVKIDGSQASTGKVTYEGNTPVVFGFQAVRLFFDKGKYTAIKPVEGFAASALSNAPNDGADRYVVDEPFATLSPM